MNGVCSYFLYTNALEKVDELCVSFEARSSNMVGQDGQDFEPTC